MVKGKEKKEVNNLIKNYLEICENEMKNIKIHIANAETIIKRGKTKMEVTALKAYKIELTNIQKRAQSLNEQLSNIIYNEETDEVF